MITREQIELAKTLWEQARQSSTLAHQSWDFLRQSQKTLLESYRKAGFPFGEATQQFEKLMDDHAQRYKTALDHMDNMAKSYLELLEQFKKDTTDDAASGKTGTKPK